jgi:hypothetical protein
MPVSVTYLVLQQTIADELGNRTDLLEPLSDSGLVLSPIENAIQSAIAKWEREQFFFNEIYDSATPLFTTVANQELYTSVDNSRIASSPYIYSLHALINSNRWPLTKRTWDWMEEIATNPAERGQPTDWAYLGQTIRLHPIPNGAYPIRSSRLDILPHVFILDESLLDGTEVLAPGETGVWSSYAYDLIRTEAKLILAQEVLHDDDLARRMKIAIYGDPALPSDRGYLYSLKAETTRRVSTRRVRATHF